MTMADSEAIATALAEQQRRVQKACEQACRAPQSVRILAVSKTKPASAVRAAYQAGQRDFGENYVQEGVDKIAELADLSDIVWHFIGPLQSNKTKLVADNFAWMQSLDRLKIARRLNDQRSDDQAPLQVLVQVNIDNEASKAGIAIDDIADFAAQLAQLPRLQLRGLMAIPAADASNAQQQQSFSALANAFKQLQTHYPQVDTLSLGMSNDLEPAIEHGSTMVRIGTSIFGKRQA
ncbi:YggS family pyridoxal phosphate-dependent enzyme [Aliidiomarina soli]